MDFRDELLDDDDESGLGNFDLDDGEIPVRLGRVIGEEDDFSATGGSGDGRILGMTAAERAFLSAMIFLNVVVLGIGALMATGRIG
jgi:hypothetical protein